MDNPVDGNLPPLHNGGNTANVLKIDKSTLRAIPNCPEDKHAWQDDDDEIGDMRAIKCVRCPLGRWVRKS